MESRKYVLNESARRIHYYPTWEECNIDEAGEDLIVLTQEELDARDMGTIRLCKHCATKPR